jgi:hypothetical protein
LSSLEKVTSLCCSRFGTADFVAYKLVQLSPDDDITEHSVAVRLNTTLSTDSICDLMEKNRELETALALSKTSLKVTMTEIDRLRDTLSLSRNKKVKKIEDENKKLRHALQVQLQDS